MKTKSNSKRTKKKNALAKTGAQAAAERLIAKAKQIAECAAKNARPAMRRKEAIVSEIEQLQAVNTKNEARIAKLRTDQQEEEKKIEAAQADAITVLNKMGAE